MQKKTNKILALVITLIMLIINFAPVTVQAAEELQIVQDTMTNEANIEFDAKVNGSYNATAQVGDEIELEFGVKLKNGGKIHNVLIKAENADFKLIESSMVNFDGLSEDGELKLKDIEGENQTVSKVKAKFNKQDKVKVSDFKNEFKITFSAVYTNEAGREKRVEKTLKENINWTVENPEAEIYQELVRYIKFDNKTIVSYRINEKVKEDKIPAKVSKVQTLIPEINKSKPETINVIGDYDEYKEQDGVLVITKNEGEIEEENNEDKGLNDKDTKEEKYNWNTEKSYIVTYIYNTQEDLQTISTTSKVEIETVLNQKIENAITTQNDVSNEVGSLIELDLEGTPVLNKGYMYTNLARESKLDTKFNIAYKVNVATKDVTDKLVLKENAYSFNEYQTNIITTKISTHRDELVKVLGEEGRISIVDKEGNEIGILNKDTEELDASTSELTFITSKPEAEGIITINVDKKVDDTIGYTREAIKSFETLNTYAVLEGYLNDNLLSKKEFVSTIKLEEPVLSADIAMEPKNLSTVVANQEVEIDVRLNNASVKDALFTDPVIQVELPNQVEGINITSADLIYEDELVPAEIHAEGNIIKATLKGTQTEYNDDGIINGSIIRINANVDVDRFATSSDEKVVLRYGNSATKEEGVRELNTEVVAPSDFITIQGLQIDDMKVEAIDDMKEFEIASGAIARNAKIAGRVVNNLKRNADGFAIVGRIPTEGMQSLTGEEISTTETTNLLKGVEVKNINAKVYYSDNVNETLDGNWGEQPLSTSKTFKIVAEEDVPHGKVIDFDYEIALPTSVDSGEEMIATYGVVYKTNAIEGEQLSVVEAKNVGVFTEGLDTVNVTMELTNTNTKRTIGENDTVQSGDYLTYKLVATNNGRTTLNNLRATINCNNDILIVDRVETTDGSELYSEFREGFTYDENGNKQIVSTLERTMTINSLAAGESKEFVFNCRVTGYDGVYYNNIIWMDEHRAAYNAAKSKENPTEEESTLIAEYEGLQQENAEERKIEITANIEYGSRSVSRHISRKKIYNDIFGYMATTTTKIHGPEDVFEVMVHIINANNIESREYEYDMTIPSQLEIKKIYLEDDVIEGAEDSILEGNELNQYIRNNHLKLQLKHEFKTWNSDTNDWDIDYKTGLEANTSKIIKIELKTKNTNRLRDTATISSIININKYDNSRVENTYILNDATFIIENNSVIHVEQRVNAEGRVRDVDLGAIRFDISIRNESDFNKTITFENSLIEHLNIYEAALTLRGKSQNIEIRDKIKADFTLNSREEAVITIYAKSSIYTKGTEYVISNLPLVSSELGEAYVNEVGFTIVGTFSEDEPPVVENKNRTISGLVWIDENNNGLRDPKEYRVSGSLVRLYYQGQIVNSTETNEKGEYKFEDLEPDENNKYYVLIDYDIENYRVSSKLIKDSELLNNDFTDEVYNNKKVASSKGITLTEDIYNLDLGLVARNAFDFDLNKYITKVKITNPEYKDREYRFVNSKMAKVELPTKNIENATLIIEYKIVVTNIGREAGYVKKVADYMPIGVGFNSELNEGWYIAQNGELYNSKYANKELKAGESIEIPLILVRKINGENLGTIRNEAEIYELYNTKGYEDANSIPGNKNVDEDDYDYADLSIFASTGKYVASIMLISIFVLSMIGIAVYSIRKELKEKNNAKEDIIKNETKQKE